MLDRSLVGLRHLISGSIDEVRFSSAVKNRRRILVSEFIEEIGAAATLEAQARGITLIVAPVQEGLAIEADQQSLAAVVEIWSRTRSSSPGPAAR